MLYVISKRINYNNFINSNKIDIDFYHDLEGIKDQLVIINEVDINMNRYLSTQKSFFVSKHDVDYYKLYRLYHFSHTTKERLIIEHKIHCKKIIRNDKINQILNKDVCNKQKNKL